MQNAMGERARAAEFNPFAVIMRQLTFNKSDVQDELYAQICELRDAGLSQYEIGEKLCLTRSRVQYLVRRYREKSR